MMKPEGESTHDKAKLVYRELIVALMYLCTATRPGISFAIICLIQFNNCFKREPRQTAFLVKGTMSLGSVYHSDNKPLCGHVDANVNDRRCKEAEDGSIVVYGR